MCGTTYDTCMSVCVYVFVSICLYIYSLCVCVAMLSCCIYMYVYYVFQLVHELSEWAMRVTGLQSTGLRFGKFKITAFALLQV